MASSETGTEGLATNGGLTVEQRGRHVGHGERTGLNALVYEFVRTHPHSTAKEIIDGVEPQVTTTSKTPLRDRIRNVIHAMTGVGEYAPMVRTGRRFDARYLLNPAWTGAQMMDSDVDAVFAALARSLSPAARRRAIAILSLPSEG